MPRFISPHPDDFSNLRTPLNEAELIVFDFFNKYLPDDWEIYIQPHMNGLRPDYVLLNPSVGIAVYEVKGWDFNKTIYYVDSDNGINPVLYGISKDTKFRIHTNNPLNKIILYKNEIYNLYCPRLQSKYGLGVITAGIIFPFVSQKDLNNLLLPFMHIYPELRKHAHLYPIIGKEQLANGNIKEVLYSSKYNIKRPMQEICANDLRNWLIEPEYSAEQRRLIRINNTQNKLITTRTETGFRRIRGPAGSGKSIVVAARASELATQGKDVLVVNFNITLKNYLMDLAVRWKQSNKVRNIITWLQYHQWCKRICYQAGAVEEYRNLWRSKGIDTTDDEDILRIMLPALVNDILKRCSKYEKYDAILVDEGQDFDPLWWETLMKVLRPGGEMVLSADITQDAYGTSKRWTKGAMTKAGFSGPWNELTISYRLPPKLAELAAEFVLDFLPYESTQLPGGQKEFHEMYPCKLSWYQCSKDDIKDIALKEILKIVKLAEPDYVSISDITFIVDIIEVGKSIVAQLEKYNIKVEHTFGDTDEESKRLKQFYYKGDARVKATTILSFKGMETKALVVCITKANTMKSKFAIYSALTRLKRSKSGSYVSVVCCADELIEYSKLWPTIK